MLDNVQCTWNLINTLYAAYLNTYKYNECKSTKQYAVLYSNQMTIDSLHVITTKWQYVQLMMDKINTADLSIGVFTILINVTQTKKYKIHCRSRNFVKNGKQWRNKGSTELYCLFIAADSIVDAISFITHIVLWSKNMFFPNPDPVPALAGFEFLNLARSG